MPKRRCLSCGEIIDSSWRFCPSCGEEQQPDLFGEFFSEFGKELRRITGSFEHRHNFEAFDATPMFSRNAGGFSVKVTRRNNEEPKVEVRTFGNVRPEDIERNLRGLPPNTPLKEGFVRIENSPRQATQAPRKPGKISEPLSKMMTEGEKVIAELALPNVSSLKDVEVTELESSIEVRGYGKEESYFKIIAIPEGAKVIGKSFSGGTLRLELGTPAGKPRETK